MLNNQHFYHRSIRKTVISFGTLFNDIELVRFTQDGTPKERFKVPLSYGSKEKYINRIATDPTLTKSISTLVPRMSFILNSISYDSTRKQITTLRNFSTNSDTGILSQYVPVPFNFDFSLSIFVRNTEDGTQILEQILPFFTPDFTVTVDFINDMEHLYDIPIILNSVLHNVDYEGDMSTTRLITWDLSFTSKGYIWPPVNGVGIIKEINTNIFTGGEMTDNTSIKTVNINTTPDPVEAEPDDEYGFTEIITIVPNL